MDAITLAHEAVQVKLPPVKHKLEEPMSNHTSFKIGGPVRVMYFPEDLETLIGLGGILRDYGVAPLIIGNGTNLLVADGALDRAVIKMTGLRCIRGTGGNEITADAGAPLSSIATLAYELGLSGMEFAHGIPGALGGALVMNAGAYGREMKDVAHETIALNPDNALYSAVRDEHSFSYRSSRFSGTGDIIVSSTLRLQEGDKAGIKARMDEYARRRSESQPLDLPSAGSTFKRPEKGYAAMLIEEAGLKGFTVGGAQVSDLHSGFIVNRGGATFSDVMAVIEHVKETVLKRSGIELRLEVKVVGRGVT